VVRVTITLCSQPPGAREIRLWAAGELAVPAGGVGQIGPAGCKEYWRASSRPVASEGLVTPASGLRLACETVPPGAFSGLGRGGFVCIANGRGLRGYREIVLARLMVSEMAAMWTRIDTAIG
jgi:hypothetical protein